MRNGQQLQLEGEKAVKWNKLGHVKSLPKPMTHFVIFLVTFQFEGFHSNMRFHHLGYRNCHYH